MVAPLTGATICTTPGVGVAEGLETTVVVGLGEGLKMTVAVAVADGLKTALAVAVGAAVAVAVPVGVAVAGAVAVAVGVAVADAVDVAPGGVGVGEELINCVSTLRVICCAAGFTTELVGPHGLRLLSPHDHCTVLAEKTDAPLAAWYTVISPYTVAPLWV